jgi:hypothetical protein
MSVRNIIVQLRNNSGSTITLGTLSIAAAASATIWDTKTFAAGVESNFEQVIAGVSTFNQNIGNGNLTMVVESVDQTAANAWIQFRDLVRSYKEESLRDDFDVLRLLRLFATGTTPGLLSSDGYTKLTQLDGYNMTELFGVTGEPSGFPTRTTSTISVNNATREFTITPVSGSYDIYINGHKITKSTAETVTFTDNEGLHYFYFDKNANLVHTTTSSEFGAVILGNGLLVSVIYWDTDSNIQILLGDERHGFMDGKTHYHLHNAFGAQWYDGGALGNITADGDGSSATHVQLSVSAVTFGDEDIILKSSDSSQVLTFPAQIPIFYRSGADGYWRRKTPDAYPMIYNGTAGYSGTYIPYNQWTGSTWQLTSAASGSFVLVHFFAGNGITDPVFGIQGQAQYQTIGDARTGASNEIASLAGTTQLLSPEFVRLGTIIVQTSVAYTNVPKARIRTTDTGGTYIDFRGASVRGTGATISDHGNLSGLSDDDHSQYLLVNGTRAMTGSLNMSGYNVTNIGTVDGYNLETQFQGITDTLASKATGAVSSTDNAVARFDGTTGKVIQNSAVTISDTAVIDGVNSISLNLLTDGYWPAWQEGLIFYDSTNHALVAYNDQSAVTQQLGQELFVRVVNKTGAIIPNGSVVYVNGAQGNRPTVALAQANDPAKALAVGIATQDITDNLEGFVTIKGIVNGVNTSTFATGDFLYVSPTVAGGLTNVKPTGQYYVWFVGIALNSTINGSVAVSVQGPVTLTSLHDVDGISSPLDGYYLRGNGTLWEGRVFSSDVLSLANVLGASSSTDNAITRFDLTTGKLLQNSLAILDDSGNLNLNSGTGTITCGNINSVSITAHGSRHNPGGLDAVTTAAAVAVGTANAEGSALSLARSDHTHQVTGLTITNQAQGDILYYSGSAWTRLAAGTSGQYLKTQGVGANPTWATAGTGDVVGPASSTDTAIPRFNGTTGKLLQNSSVTIDGYGNIDTPGILYSTGWVMEPDVTIMPKSGGQSALASWWGFQLVGNKQSTIYDYVPTNIGNPGDYGIIVPCQQAGSVAMMIRGASAQTGNLLEFRNSSNTLLSYIDKVGDGYHLALNYTPSSYSVVNNYVGEHVAALDRTLASYSVGPAYTFDGFDATGGTDITSATTVPLDTERVKDSIYTHSTSTSNGEVTITKTAKYRVTYTVGTQVLSGSTISSSASWLELNTGSGFAEVSGSRGVMVNNQASYGGTNVSRTLILNLTAGYVLRVRAQRTNGTTAVSLLANSSSLVIQNVTAVNAVTSTPSAHASTHLFSGSDEIDGDTLGITWSPTYYTRTTVAQASSVNHLTAHLAGVDTFLGTTVVGPTSATNNIIPVFSGSTGKLIKTTGVTLDGYNNIGNINAASFDAEGSYGNSGDGYITINFTTLGQKAAITLTGSPTISFTFPGVGNYILKLTQDGTGNRAPTLSSNVRAASGSISLSKAASSITIWALYYDGTNIYVSSMPSASTATVTLV